MRWRIIIAEEWQALEKERRWRRKEKEKGC
jgi:hypothetical protein